MAGRPQKYDRALVSTTVRVTQQQRDWLAALENASEWVRGQIAKAMAKETKIAQRQAERDAGMWAD